MAALRRAYLVLSLIAALTLGGVITAPAQAVEPIKIGFGMGLTGGSPPAARRHCWA